MTSTCKFWRFIFCCYFSVPSVLPRLSPGKLLACLLLPNPKTRGVPTFLPSLKATSSYPSDLFVRFMEKLRLVKVAYLKNVCEVLTLVRVRLCTYFILKLQQFTVFMGGIVLFGYTIYCLPFIYTSLI